MRCTKTKALLMRETLGSIRPRDVTLMTSLHFSNARRQRKITIKIALLILSLRCAFQILVFLWARSSHVAHFKEWALVSETCRALCAVRWLDTSKAISFVFFFSFLFIFFARPSCKYRMFRQVPKSCKVCFCCLSLFSVLY